MFECQARMLQCSKMFVFIAAILAICGSASSQFFNNRPYPTYSLEHMPDTAFSCRDKILGGYYADPETQCQMFHVCVKVAGVGVQDFRFLCPNGTAFDQDSQICADWNDVDCEASTLYYASDNFDLYRIGSGFETKSVPYSGEDESSFHLQRADTGDFRLHREHQVNSVNQKPEYQGPQTKNDRDIFRGSSSSNFFNNRNGGKEDDYETHSDVSGSDRNVVQKEQKPFKKIVRRPTVVATTTTTTTTTSTTTTPAPVYDFSNQKITTFKPSGFRRTQYKQYNNFASQSTTAKPTSTTNAISQEQYTTAINNYKSRQSFNQRGSFRDSYRQSTTTQPPLSKTPIVAATVAPNNTRHLHKYTPNVQYDNKQSTQYNDFVTTTTPFYYQKKNTQKAHNSPSTPSQFTTNTNTNQQYNNQKYDAILNYNKNFNQAAISTTTTTIAPPNNYYKQDNNQNQFYNQNNQNQYTQNNNQYNQNNNQYNQNNNQYTQNSQFNNYNQQTSTVASQQNFYSQNYNQQNVPTSQNPVTTTQHPNHNYDISKQTTNNFYYNNEQQKVSTTEKYNVYDPALYTQNFGQVNQYNPTTTTVKPQDNYYNNAAFTQSKAPAAFNQFSTYSSTANPFSSTVKPQEYNFNNQFNAYTTIKSVPSNYNQNTAYTTTVKPDYTQYNPYSTTVKAPIQYNQKNQTSQFYTPETNPTTVKYNNYSNKKSFNHFNVAKFTEDDYDDGQYDKEKYEAFYNKEDSKDQFATTYKPKEKKYQEEKELLKAAHSINFASGQNNYNNYNNKATDKATTFESPRPFSFPTTKSVVKNAPVATTAKSVPATNTAAKKINANIGKSVAASDDKSYDYAYYDSDSHLADYDNIATEFSKVHRN